MGKTRLEHFISDLRVRWVNFLYVMFVSIITVFVIQERNWSNGVLNVLPSDVTSQLYQYEANVQGIVAACSVAAYGYIKWLEAGRDAAKF